MREAHCTCREALPAKGTTLPSPLQHSLCFHMVRAVGGPGVTALVPAREMSLSHSPAKAAGGGSWATPGWVQRETLRWSSQGHPPTFAG